MYFRLKGIGFRGIGFGVWLGVVTLGLVLGLEIGFGRELGVGFVSYKPTFISKKKVTG